jgi:tRNA threonylcarbamoyladenosine biosynthesis protein TsaB
MPSLSQLLAGHKNVLVLDAASTQTQVGLLQANTPSLWRHTPEEAGRGMFVSAQGILSGSGLRLDDIDAFIFCEGPGSMLGVRTVAMALRTWVALKPRAIYFYQSLALAARTAWLSGEKRAFTVIADARRDTWHEQPIDSTGQLSPLRRVAAVDFPSGELITPENFRAWSKPPRPVGSCSYDLARLFATLKDEDLFCPTEAPDAFQHEAPEYKKSPAVIHSIETIAKK